MNFSDDEGSRSPMMEASQVLNEDNSQLRADDEDEQMLATTAENCEPSTSRSAVVFRATGTKPQRQTSLTVNKRKTLGFTSVQPPPKKKATAVPPQSTNRRSKKTDQTDAKLEGRQMSETTLLKDLHMTVLDGSGINLHRLPKFLDFAGALYGEMTLPDDSYPITILIVLHFLAMTTELWKDVSRTQREQFVIASLEPQTTEETQSLTLLGYPWISKLMNEIREYFQRFPTFSVKVESNERTRNPGNPYRSKHPGRFV